MKIRAKVFVTIFIPTIVFAILGMGIFYLFSYLSLKNKICDHLCSTAKYKALWITSYLIEEKRDADVLSKMPAISNYLTELEDAQAASGMDAHSFLSSDEYSTIMKSMDAYLKTLKKQHGQYNIDIFIIDHNGNILYTIMQEAVFGTNILNGPYKDTALGKAVRSAIETKEVAFADYTYYSSSDEPAAFLANTIYDNKGGFRGVIAVQLPVHEINEIMQDRTGLGETGETYLVGRDLLMRSDSRFFEEGTILEQKVDTENTRTCFANSTSYKEGEKYHEKALVFTDYRGVRVIGARFYLPELDWVLLAEIDEAEAFAPLRLLFLVFALVGAIIIFFSFILSSKLGKTISRPILDLHHGTEIIGKGNLNCKVGTVDQDEIGQLSRAFDKMTESLQNTTASRDELDKEITERKLAEEEVRKTNDYLTNAIENSLDAIVITDSKGCIARANQSFLKLTDGGKQEIIGKHMAEFSPMEEGIYESTTGELVQLGKEYLDEVTTFEARLIEGGRIANYETYILCNDKEIIPVEENITLLYNEKRERIGAMGVIRNITERKEMEIALKKSHQELEKKVEERTANLKIANVQLQQEINVRKQAEEELKKTKDHLDNIIESSVDSIVVSDSKGKITRVNKAFSKLIGYKEEEITGKYWYNLRPNVLGTYELITGDLLEINEDFFNDVKAVAPKLLEEGKIENRESYLLHKNGKVLLVENNIVLLYNKKGDVIGGVAIIRDIAQRKKAEEKILQYQNRLKSLSSQMTLTEEKERKRFAEYLHDQIGQRLFGLKLKMEEVRNSAYSSNIAECLDDSFEIITQLIKDTRSLTFDLSPPILYQFGLEAALEWLTEQTSEQYGIMVAFEDDEQEKGLNNDLKILLFQAVRELLFNVAKHAQAQNVKVSIQRDNSHIRIFVEDNGVGFTTSSGDVSKAAREGFGLFSIKERLDHFGGQFNIESESGRGTRVMMVAPLKDEK